jgi:hypothetical protein
LQLADGSTQAIEVSAGSGYFSQSSATAFFAYTDPAPPVRLTIRWPDGTLTERPFETPPTKVLRISHP